MPCGDSVFGKVILWRTQRVPTFNPCGIHILFTKCSGNDVESTWISTPGGDDRGGVDDMCLGEREGGIAGKNSWEAVRGDLS